MGKAGRITVWTLGIVLAGVFAAMVAQHLHYLDARRDALHDLQDIFYPGDVLHAATFLQVAPGDDLFDAMRAMRAATDAFPGAKTVYAGKAAMNAISSAQLTAAFGEEVAWDAVALLQFDDRAAYHAWREDERVQAALTRFATTYAHGMKRPPTINLMLHQVFLAWRFVQAVTFQPHVLPFEPAAVDPVARLGWARRDRLLEERELGGNAILVANLAKDGTPDEVAANEDYGLAMLPVMARGGHGPMHVGAGVTLEGDVTFESIIFVYYPGLQYFHDLTGSTFYAGVVGDKQLGDTQVTVTVPILHLL
ncbi:MAG: hypothetical protein OXM56_09365 [Gammaproteobacteria bacterium]|nr:hypothetical protein [Gammaproteobacteria bacterium]